MEYIDQFTERFQKLYKSLKQDRKILSNQEMARKIGVVEGSIRNYLKRQREPKFEALSRICRAYKVRPAWLLLGSGSMFEKEKSIISKTQRMILDLHRNHSEEFTNHLRTLVLFHISHEDQFQLKIAKQRESERIGKTDELNKRSKEWKVLFLELEKTLFEAQKELTSGDFEEVLIHIMKGKEINSDFKKFEIKPWVERTDSDQTLISMNDLFDLVSSIRFSMQECLKTPVSSKKMEDHGNSH